MAGARALWVANGMKKEQFGKPIIAIANSFTQFVPGHTHLHEAGQLVKKEIEKLAVKCGCAVVWTDELERLVGKAHCKLAGVREEHLAQALAKELQA